MSSSTPRPIWLTLGLIAIGLAIASVVLTEWLHLEPCYLCIFQRLLMFVLGALALLTALALGTAAGRWLGATVALIGSGGIATAAYQTWLQWQPPGSATCLSADPGLIERLVEWLGQLSPSLFLATGFCEDAGLWIFHLSLANWSLVCFALLSGVAVWTSWRQREQAAEAHTRPSDRHRTHLPGGLE